MRFRVELHRDVVWFIRHVCSPDERRDFQERLDRLRDDPLAESEPCTEIELSRWLLRVFRFGGNVAVFQLDLHRERILVRQCRRLRGRDDPESTRKTAA